MSRYTRRPSPYYDRAFEHSRDRRKVWRLGRLATVSRPSCTQTTNALRCKTLAVIFTYIHAGCPQFSTHGCSPLIRTP
jgi:hypothetical protein